VKIADSEVLMIFINTLFMEQRIEKLRKSSFGDVVDLIVDRVKLSDSFTKAAVFNKMSETEFIEHRLSQYFIELEQSVVSGLTLEEAHESAISKCLMGLANVKVETSADSFNPGSQLQSRTPVE